MSTKYKFILLIILLTFSACIHRQYIPGKTEFVGIYDTLINDSSIIEGNIRQFDSLIKHQYSPGDFIVRLKYTFYSTENDNNGHYLLKIPPGTYSIQCKSSTDKWDLIKEGINKVKVGPNQKARIDFYMGLIAE